MDRLLRAWRRLRALKPTGGRDLALMAFTSAATLLVAALIVATVGGLL